MIQYFSLTTVSKKSFSRLRTTIFYLSLFSFFTLFFLACDAIGEKQNDRLVARAENHYLYLSDLRDRFEAFASAEDSLIKVNNYINEWARQKLLYEKSLINLPEEKISQLRAMVQQYETGLFRTAYREYVLKSALDTIIDTGEVLKFYQENGDLFRLKEPLYRIRYISLPKDNVDRKAIIRHFRNNQKEAVQFLDSLSFQFTNFFLSDSVWLRPAALKEKLTFINKQNESFYLKSPGYFELKDSLALYLFELVERLEQNQMAPLSHVENTIKNIVFNQKKIDFLRSFNKDVVEDAIKTKKFEKY